MLRRLSAHALASAACLLFTAALAALGLLPAAAAASSTRVGHPQSAPPGGGMGSGTYLNVQTAPASPSYVLPAGIVTSWSFYANTTPGQVRLKVFRPAGGGQFTVVAQSDYQSVAASSLNTFATHLQVQAGDLIGVTVAGTGSGPQAWYTAGATTADKEAFWANPEPALLSSSSPAFTADQFLMNISATVLSDSDSDGRADDTEDNCPSVANPDQANADGDALGDACDADDDNDGLSDAKDGMVRAFDVRSGELRWEFSPIPADKAKLTGAANVWSTISVDPQRNLVFVPTTSPSTDYYGGGRQFEIPLANSIVALDGKTGQVAWHFQTIHHDLFDYDLVGHPLLVDIRRGGKVIPAALLQTKMGWLYGFDRGTGAPLWPIVEKPVPPTDVPGDRASPTQPVPTGMAPFAHQVMKREDLFGLTPLDKLACQRTFDKSRYDGMYTPPSIKGSILFPSALGGGNWGGASYDPKQNLLVIKAENLATLIKVVKKDGAKGQDEGGVDYLTRPLVGTPYRVEGEIFQSPLGIPCTPPPWGTLAALDLDSGKIKWQIPLGQVRRAGVTIPEGTQSGTSFRIRNKGVPVLNGHGKGDLYVEVRVQTPSKLTKRQRELLSELGQISPVENKPQRRSLLGRMKDMFV